MTIRDFSYDIEDPAFGAVGSCKGMRDPAWRYEILPLDCSHRGPFAMRDVRSPDGFDMDSKRSDTGDNEDTVGGDPKASSVFEA